MLRRRFTHKKTAASAMNAATANQPRMKEYPNEAGSLGCISAA